MQDPNVFRKEYLGDFICLGKNFSPLDIVLSCICDFILLFILFIYLFFDVTTITLERLNQSEPDFHLFFFLL